MHKLATLTLYACVACGGADEASLALVDLANPSGPGAEAPNLTRGADGEVYLSWIERSDDEASLLFSALSSDGWQPARTIASGADWFVNWADIPSLAALADGTLIAHWLQKTSEGTYDYDVRFSMSRDGGNTWSEARVLHDDTRPSEHGFVSIVPLEGRFSAVWLDGGNMPGGGSMTLHQREITADGELLPESELDDRVCECCPTSLSTERDGTLHVAYRDRSSEENRNIAILSSTATGWESRAVPGSDWTVPACPVNGPRVVTAQTIEAYVVWFNGGDEPSVWLSDLTDDSAPATRIDVGVALGRIDAAFDVDGSLTILWLEDMTNGFAEWMVARIHPDGSTQVDVLAETGSQRASGRARIALSARGLVVAWRDVEGANGIQTALLTR